jgi:YesN/AraC family two-component response regulator
LTQPIPREKLGVSSYKLRITVDVSVKEEMLKTILVIEDNPQTRKIFLESLATRGFYTIGAENGLVGLQRVEEKLPDLIICDITMPVLDGYGVITKLRQNPANAIIPFIFVSGRTTRNDIRKGMELGADDYLTKPCSLKELLAAITIQLKKRTTLQQWYVAESQPVSEQPANDTASLPTLHSIFPASSQMAQVFRFLEENYHQPITLGDVAQAAGYSPAYLTNLIRQQTGKSIHRWLVERRMAQAIALLLKTEHTVSKIAETVGYQDVCHFSRYFRQFYGTSPQAWRNEHRCTTAAS